jgi:hypothetical protein
MRRVVLVVLAAGFLALPAPASAKELERLVVCGQTDCVTIKDRNTLRAFVFDAVPTGREPSGMYYVIDASFAAEDGTHTMRLEYDVAANMIRPVDEPGGIGWARLIQPQSARFVEALDGLEPFGTTKKATTEKPRTAKRADGGFSWLSVLPAALGVAAVATSGFAVVRKRRRRF